MSRKLNTPDKVMVLITLVPHLLEHGTRSVTELADTYDVDPSVMRELVRFLGLAGVPGETRTYQHDDLFDIDWDALEQHDLVRLTHVVAVDDTPRFSTVETATLIAGLHSLLPMLTPELRLIAQSAAAKLAAGAPSGHTQTAVTVTADATQIRLQNITEAIKGQRDLSFEYRDASGTQTQRTVRPLALRQNADTWYLQAYCHDRDAERLFMVDRMRGEQVAQTAGAEVAAISSAQPPSLLPLTATLRIRAAMKSSIAEFLPRVVEELADGWLRVEVDLRHAAVAVRLVQAAPGNLVIESPKAAREAVQSWAARALAQYDG